MHGPGPRFLVFLFVDQTVLEVWRQRQDGAADPRRVVAFGRCADHDLGHGLRRQPGHRSLQTFGQEPEQRGAAVQHDVVVHGRLVVDLAGADRLVHQVVNAAVFGLDVEHRRVEYHFGALEPAGAGFHLFISYGRGRGSAKGFRPGKLPAAAL